MVAKHKEHGSALLRQRAYDLEFIRLGQKVRDYDHILERLFDSDIIVKGMSIRHPLDVGEGYLVVLRVVEAGTDKVGFHSAPTFAEVIEGLINRLKNRTLKFKDDEYANSEG